MKRKRLRYEVRPSEIDPARFVVWDTVTDRAACNGWRFGQRQYADDAASSLNSETSEET